MTNKKRWTVEEEQVLIDQIKRSANNITEAFRRTSRLINRTEAACTYHWYVVISKRENPSVCFVTVGQKTKNVNRKNVALNTSDNTEKTTISWWKIFLNFLNK